MELPFDLPSRLDTPVAIIHVNVIPMDRNCVLTDQTVIIDQGLIREMGASEVIDVQNMETIDGSNRYLLPGLTDMHMHVWSPDDIALFLAHGVTLVRNMSGAPFHLGLRKKIEMGDLPGPRIVTTSPIIEGDAPILPMWHRLTDPENARDLVRKCVARGYEQTKVYNALTPDVLEALGKASAEIGVRMTGHCPNTVTFEEAMDAGMTCFEHLVGIWRGHLKSGITLPERPNLDFEVLQKAAYQIDLDTIRHLADRMAQEQIWNCPTLVCMQWMYESQHIGINAPDLQPLMCHVPRVPLQFWRDIDPCKHWSEQNPHSYQEWINVLHARNQTFSDIVRILHEAGAPLMIGTDAPVRFVIQGYSVHQELQNFSALGISPFEILRYATCEAARFLGEEDVWGTLAVGKSADMILVRKNPLDDVRNVSTLESVFVNGYYISREDLDILLKQHAAWAISPPTDWFPKIQKNIQNDDVDSGILTHLVGDTEHGRITYNCELDGNDFCSDERSVFQQGQIFDLGGVRERHVRLHLGSDCTVQDCQILETSFAGETQTTLKRDQNGCYLLFRIDEDQYETQESLNIPLLLPDPRLALMAVPKWLSDLEAEVDYTALNIEASGVINISSLHFTKEVSDKKVVYDISIESDISKAALCYELTADGKIIRLSMGNHIFEKVS